MGTMLDALKKSGLVDVQKAAEIEKKKTAKLQAEEKTNTKASSNQGSTEYLKRFTK